MLDEKTGLPELPEGWRWRIRNEMKYAGGYFLSEYFTGRLEIVAESVKVVTTFAEKNRYGLFGKKVIDTTKSTESEEWSTRYAETLHGDHPIAARNAAHRIVKRMQKDAMRDALIGTYPPKNLEMPQ